MCIFCDIIAGRIPSKKVYEDEDVLAILDISQVTFGHTLIMPKKHVRNIVDSDEETVLKTVSAVHRLAKQIRTNTGAPALNVLSNCGEEAGQSVDHLHFHIIPRYGKEDACRIEFAPSKEQDLDEVLKTLTK